MDDDFDEISGPELNADEEALLKQTPSLEDVGVSRRDVRRRTVAAGLGFFSLDLLHGDRPGARGSLSDVGLHT